MEVQDILFQYLKDLIYHVDKAQLDLKQLPAEFQKLGQGMQLLGKWMEQNRKFSLAMAKGNLSYDEVDRENAVAAPMKELQSMLRHLAWQTQQVAKGDYSQVVDFMGEFSEDFNTMTRQLQERRDALLEEKSQMERKNMELEQTFELATAFADYTQNMIFVHSTEEQEKLFENKSAKRFIESKVQEGQELISKLKEKEVTQSIIWEIEIAFREDMDTVQYFQVESYPIVWRSTKAVIHIVLDDTKRRRKENLMYELVYIDDLTGLYNKRYAMETMNRWVNKGVSFVISYIDIDYLKYCNDTYGHRMGDRYLRETAKALGRMDGILCRSGGDEFIILKTERTVKEQNQDLEKIRSLFQRDGNEEIYPRSFSYASCEVPGNSEKSIEQYMVIADSLMYRYKSKNKKPLKDVLYKDDRKLNEESF